MDKIDQNRHKLCELSPVEPFSWATLCEVLQRFPHPFAERVTSQGTLRRLFMTSQNELVEVHIDPERPTAPKSCLRKVSHVFELDSPIRAKLKAHPQGAVIGRAVELPILRWEDSFAAMVSTIIEQQTNWKSATRDIHFFFSVAHRKQNGLSVFPAPQEILQNPGWLDSLKITYRRRKLILELAEEMNQNPNHLDSLCVDPKSAEGNLLKLPGVGPWTARVFLSKRFGWRPDVPYNDVALQRAAAYFYLKEERKMTEEELKARFTEFGDLAGEAAHRLLLRWVLEQYR